MVRPTRRREFLRTVTVGGAGALAGLGGIRSARADHLVSFGCSEVSFSPGAKDVDAGSARIAFEDGGYVWSIDSYADLMGSTGRAVTAAEIGRSGLERPVNRIENPDPRTCNPRATTFDDNSVTVGEGEFDTAGVPPVEAARVTLYFRDGSSEVVSDIGERNVSSVTTTYTGTGQNTDKAITSIKIEHSVWDTTNLVANPATTGAFEWTDSRVLDIVTTDDVEMEYELLVDGTVEKRTGIGEPLRAEPNNDTVTENGDETVTVSGFTGNAGYGDSYRIDGRVLAFEQTAGDAERDDYAFLVNGAPVASSLLGPGLGAAGRTLFQIVGTEEGEVSYEFTVDGTVEKRTDNSDRLKAEDNDEVTENGDGTVTVSGFTGNTGYGDSFVVSGDLESFDRTGGDAGYRLVANGRDVELDELL